MIENIADFHLLTIVCVLVNINLTIDLCKGNRVRTLSFTNLHARVREASKY